ncbi:MAG: hypothetical protein ABIK92_17960 [Pseudomonadota bacterium]
MEFSPALSLTKLKRFESGSVEYYFFDKKMNALTAKLSEQFARDSKLEKTIRENLKGMGYEFYLSSKGFLKETLAE